jgi:ABC-type transport system involved in multi-copper enzyme maturation permease subunit
MKRVLNQLWGIVWYELWLQWRRRSLLIMGLCFVAVLLLFLFLVTNQLETPSPEMSEIAVTAATFSLILGVTPVALLLLLLALPPIVAEAIARDQQLGMAELRDTLPVPVGLYLMGKVLGVWAGITLMVALMAVLSGLFGWARLGGLHIGPYVRIWLTAILPAGLFVSGLSVLLAARQPTRKRAALLGGGVAIYSFLTMIMIIEPVYDWLHAALPAAWLTLALRAAFQYMAQSTTLPAPLLPLVDVPALFVWQTAVMSALQLIVVWLLMWGSWRWRRA